MDDSSIAFTFLLNSFNPFCDGNYLQGIDEITFTYLDVEYFRQDKGNLIDNSSVFYLEYSRFGLIKVLLMIFLPYQWVERRMIFGCPYLDIPYMKPQFLVFLLLSAMLLKYALNSFSTNFGSETI